MLDAWLRATVRDLALVQRVRKSPRPETAFLRWKRGTDPCFLKSIIASLHPAKTKEIVMNTHEGRLLEPEARMRLHDLLDVAKQRLCPGNMHFRVDVNAISFE
jgi:hypothetical protein